MLNAKAFAVFRAVFWLSAKAREKGTHLAPRPISPGHTRIRLNGHLTSWCTGHQTQPLSNSGTVLLDTQWAYAHYGRSLSEAVELLRMWSENLYTARGDQPLSWSRRSIQLASLSGSLG